MKISDHILSIAVIALVMTTAGAGTASAQFGGLGKKLKQSVKTKVDDAARNAKNDAKNKANDQVKDATGYDNETRTYHPEGDAPVNYKKTYTPSDEAKAADPLATSTEVQNGFTKSRGEIHAFYENLPDEIVISYFKPYYKEENKKWYDLDDTWHDRHMYAFMNLFEKNLAATEDYRHVFADYFEVAPGVKIPADQTFQNAWTLQYIADPTSSSAFVFYLYAYAYSRMENHIWTTWEQPKGSVLPADYNKILFARNSMAFELATTVLPYSVLNHWADFFIADIEKKSDVYGKYFSWIMANTILKNIMPKHEKHNTSDDAYRVKLSQFEAKYENVDFGRQLGLSKKAAVDEPKGVTVSAEIKAIGNKAGKEITYGEFEKLIYHASKWSELKEQKYPYRTTGYGISVSIVFKTGGKRYVLPGQLVKATQGNNAFIQNADPSMAKPLK
ncbi:MAG: hypothetical protein SO064_00995 [Prevotella sp.]|nr:hypothetical protein [Prevotella sp.]